jgi:peptidoglycan/LPS O-acetylase OafA/YrhL
MAARMQRRLLLYYVGAYGRSIELVTSSAVEDQRHCDKGFVLETSGTTQATELNLPEERRNRDTAPDHTASRAVPPTASESPNLDFLRAVAVLAVFSKHFLAAIGRGPHWPLGAFGVMIFFVHTSLVLMMSLERIRLSSSPLFKTFYIRRFFRIYPLSVLCVASIAVFHLPQVPHPDLPTLLANLFLCMNLFYKTPMNPVLWSLPYEVQMYLVLPILYLLGKKYRVRGILVLWPFAVIVALIQPHIAGRLDIAMYGPCFLAGVTCYFIGFGVKRRRLPFIGWPVVIAAGGGIFAYATIHGFRSVGMWTMCVLIGLTAPLFVELRTPLLRKCCGWIARYSYGIYLVHVYAVWVGVQVMTHQPWWIRSITILTVAFGLPVLLYHSVESPLIRLGVLLTRRKRVDLRPTLPAMSPLRSQGE